MQDETRRRWLEMCAEAAMCEDAEKMQQLTDTINAVLKEEKQRIEASQTKNFRVAS